MTSQSDKKAEEKTGTSRAGLPFEPRKKKASGTKGGTKDKGTSATDSNEQEGAQKKGTQKKGTQKKSADKKAKSSASDISARAQARADEILAGNRRKAEAKKAGAKKSAVKTPSKDDSGAIPEEVSRRMLRRMGILSGAPVALGVGIFFLSYYLQSRQLVELPPVAVLLVTMGCFGLGVLGLTYGVLSASWDSEPGSLIGISEFKLNFGRVMDARKASKT